MEVDDCVIEDSTFNTAKAAGMLSQTRTSPTTPASAKKLVQARLPFKPLHTAQYGSDGVAIKKRKLIDTNANFEQAKTLKKTEEEREIIEIDCNSDDCKVGLELDDHSQIPVIHSMQDTEEADNKLVCIDDESALASKTELQEPIEASKENCSLADECQAVSAVHILHSTANHVSESCIVNKSNLNCGVDAASEGLTTCLDIEDGADQISSESTESDALECNVSKEVLQLTSGLQDCETDNSVSSTNLTESMEVSECAKLRECNTELMKSAEKAWDNQAEAITKSTLEGGSTPTSKKRKSMDMKVNSLKKEQKEERERQKALEKERKEKEKEEAKLKKQQERQEKEKEREKEKAEKEKEKAEKRKQKEDEKMRKQEQLLEEKKKREEAKLEEKKKKEEKKEKQEEKTLKEKELMQKFFVKSAKDPAVQKIPNQKDVDVGQLYIHLLKDVDCRPKSYPATWPSNQFAEDVVMLPCSEQAAGCFMRAKLFQFHDNYRPAYYGTWRKRSREIRPRNPWRLDKQLLDYEVDSDEEWEEEEPGESLSHSEPDDDDEDDADPDEDTDGFFVPHGYLSEGEGCEDDDDDDDVKGSPGKLKARQLAKARNWEAELRFKKSETLHPIVIGVCWWTPESSSSDPLYSKLREFQIQLYESPPVSTCLPTKEAPMRRNKQEKTDKKVDGKNVIWVPVPDAALADLVRLVHGNESSIKKLIREFCEFWRCKLQPQDGSAPADGEKQRLLSKRQLEAKIRQIAVYESRPEYPRRRLWYINAETLDKLELASLPVPTQWKWLTKTAKL